MALPQDSNPTPSSGAGQTIFFERSPLNVPLNLAQWVAPAQLVQWIREAIDQLDASRPEQREFLQCRPEERPAVLLAVLVFAYATERYISSEIVRACHSDPELRGLCQDKPPFADELEHFRRKHRVLIEGLLGKLLIRAVQGKFVEVGQLPPGLQHALSGQAVDQVDIARHLSMWDE